MAQPPKKRVDTAELVRKWQADKKSRVFLQLAEQYRKDDYVDAALTVLREGLQHHPNFQPAHVALARCLLAKRELAAAQAELEAVTAKSPDNLMAGKLLADVLEERGERSRALEVLQRLSPFALEDPEVGARVEQLEAQLATPLRRTSGSGETSEYGTSEFATESGDTQGFDTGGGQGESAAIEAPAEPAAAAAAVPEPVPPEPTPEPPAARFAESQGSDEAVVAPEAEAEVGSSPLRLDDDELTPPPMPAARVEPFGGAETSGPVEDAEPGGGPLDDLLGTPPDAVDDSEPDALASRTLAELHEAQGSYEEASAIYEKLLSARPGEPALRAALERCRAAASPRAVVAGPEPAPAAPPERPDWRPQEPVLPAPAEPAAAQTEGELDLARLRALAGELERWLAAVRTVRQ